MATTAKPAGPRRQQAHTGRTTPDPGCRRHEDSQTLTDAHSGPGRTLVTLDRDAVTATSQLTAADVDLITQLAAGLTNATIGRRLGITRQAVASRLTIVYAKIGATNRTHAVAIATRAGLIQ